MPPSPSINTRRLGTCLSVFVPQEKKRKPQKHTLTLVYWCCCRYRVYDELFRTGDEKQAYYDLTSFSPEDPKER